MTISLERPRQGYIPTLDGWRSVAIVGVMLYHAGPLVPQFPLLSRVQAMGSSGVQLFFAISGILICSRLCEEELSRGAISLRNFYLRRLFRIQPAAFVFLIALALIGATRMIAFDWGGWWTSVFSVRNLYESAHPKTDGSVYTSHFWSLAVEEHFYLVLPWLLVLFRGSRRVLWFGVLAILSLLANEAMHRTDLANRPINTEFELCWLFLAAWLALLIRIPAVRAWCVRMLQPAVMVPVLLLLFVSMMLRWKVLDRLFLPALPFLVISTTLHPQSLSSRFLEWAPLRHLGRISYSLYLWQQLFAMNLNEIPQAGMPLGLLQHFPLKFIVPVALAFGSYLYVEKPMIRVGHRLTSRTTV